ncbi:uncharacterized protein DUF4446 [Motilibacter rhizosphaerae]|uniref:Uncharacterized protein DUF4446 n=1 Tax=Motilibacter rhizosphaerae TaxID=598652 RepID=A0A4Q7NY35_9ACTN|nr:uncharacterized protein DUF4446 [Motilibacter rhizosphaerae]
MRRVPTPDASTAGQLAVAALAVAVVALLVALVALVRLRAARRTLAALGADDRTDLLGVLGRLQADIGQVRTETEAAMVEAKLGRAEVADSLRHVSVVRYDAFGDMGGRLSFSAALLDDGGDGLVLTSINGRTETRTYAKGVKAGRSEHTLSPEEEQAVQYASRGRQ